MSETTWRPITTIPEDERVLVYINDPSGRTIAFGKACRYVHPTQLIVSAEGYNGDWRITHWAPLPPPPTV